MKFIYSFGLICLYVFAGLLNIGCDRIVFHYIGHVQNPAVANFRDDLTGLEAVSINFRGNQWIIHYYDQDGNIYYDFEPNQFGSM